MATIKKVDIPKVLIPVIITLFFLTACQGLVVSTSDSPKRSTILPSTSLEEPTAEPKKSRPIPDPQKSTQSVNTPYQKFDISAANTNVPDDIIEVLDYFIFGQRDYASGYNPEENNLNMSSEKVGKTILFHLTGFEPKENIRFFVYRYEDNSAHFYVWDRFQADKNGKLIISYENLDLSSEYYFAAIGDTSGECLHEENAFMLSIIKFESFQECPNAPDQRVRIGEKARVCTKSDNLKVRAGPGKSNDTLRRIPPGTKILIIDGPICSDNMAWWEIRLDDGTEGWVAEGGDQTDPYYICPIN